MSSSKAHWTFEKYSPQHVPRDSTLFGDDWADHISSEKSIYQIEDSLDQEDLVSPHAADEMKNLQDYGEWLNEIAIRAEMGFPFPEVPSYNADLLRPTLGLLNLVSPHPKGSDFEVSKSEENLDNETLTGREGAQKGPSPPIG